MIIDGIVLHDFGVYGGRQALDLSPDGPERPIVLVGGLNGGGKTTLLEAVQLCLYGPAAPSARRAAGGYLEHLRRRVHRGRGARGASLELTFRHATEGVEHAWRVIRSWVAVPGSPCRETLEVLRDGRLDPLATSSWGERVEEFLPARIADLFLFDGEKVEAYADPDEAPALIATAVHNLLGLDVVERLGLDLAVFERRLRGDRPQEAGPAAEARAGLEAAAVARTAVGSRLADARAAADRVATELAQVENRFRREGGELYERRSTIEATATVTERLLAEAERDACEVAGGTGPLLMVSSLLEGAAARAASAREAARAAALLVAVEAEHAALLALPEIGALPAAARSAVSEALSARRDALAPAPGDDAGIELTAEAAAAIGTLAAGGLDAVREEVASAAGRLSDALAARSDAAQALAAAPEAGALEALMADRAALGAEAARLRKAIDECEEALAVSERDVERLAEREARLAEEEVRTRFRADDADRMAANSARTRGTLIRFRAAVVARHVARIEALVLESFRALARKAGLVSSLRIDPDGYALTLDGADGAPLRADQLSAGERQLLAVAILWGLARAAGRPLPTIIDTPLGRLDSVHRSRLVERYLPHASHQVVLLSTDEEIAGGYLDALAPRIARTYRLEFNEDERATRVVVGYLEDARRVA